MTEQDKGRFSSAMGILCEAIPNAPEFTKRKAAVFFAVLKPQPIEAVEAATEAWLRRDTAWFPTPGQLLALCTGRTEVGATLAWLDLVAEVRRRGAWQTPTLPEATMETVRVMWGSWRNLCETLPGPDSPMFVATAKRFEASYAALAERREQPGYLGPAEAKRVLASVLKDFDAHRRALASGASDERRADRSVASCEGPRADA
jgi:hypothetical protein